MIYYRARYYDPQVGRFTQADPVGLEGGVNLYAYAGGNPTNFVDPLGTTQVGITQLRNTFTQQRSYTASRGVAQGNKLSFTQIGTLSQELNNAIGTVGALASLSPQGRGARAAVTLGTKLKKVVDAAKGLGQTIKAGFTNLVKAGKKVFGFGAKEFVDPKTIRFSQDTIKGTFRNGQSVQDLATGLKNGSIKPGDVPAIRTVERNGHLISIDNRRLAAFREAGIAIRTRPATGQEIAQAQKQGKFSAGTLGSDTIRIRGQ